MKIKGKNMILFYGIGDTYKAVAYSTDASLDLSRSLIDVGGKTTGSWDEKKEAILLSRIRYFDP